MSDKLDRIHRVLQNRGSLARLDMEPRKTNLVEPFRTSWLNGWDRADDELTVSIEEEIEELNECSGFLLKILGCD